MVSWLFVKGMRRGENGYVTRLGLESGGDDDIEFRDLASGDRGPGYRMWMEVGEFLRLVMGKQREITMVSRSMEGSETQRSKCASVFDLLLSLQMCESRIQSETRSVLDSVTWETGAEQSMCSTYRFENLGENHHCSVRSLSHWIVSVVSVKFTQKLESVVPAASCSCVSLRNALLPGSIHP